MELKWNKLGWQEFGKLIKQGYDSVLIPIGTIEAHGVIPLGTDNIIPETMAERLAPKTKSLIAPTINYGITKSLLSYPGSLTVGSAAFQNYVTEIMLSMVKAGMKKLVVLNGHGGQFDELKNAAFEVYSKTDARVAVIHWWVLCGGLVDKHFGTSGGHAAVDETAAIIACAPDTVRPDDYDPGMLYPVKPGTNVYPNPSTILIYKENTGELNFDSATANKYFDDVCGAVEKFILQTFKSWDQ